MKVKFIVKDATEADDILFLIKDEEEAIAGYKERIARTVNPSLVAIFSHILEEEVEHLEELRNAQAGKFEIDDAKTVVANVHEGYVIVDTYEWLKKKLNANVYRAMNDLEEARRQKDSLSSGDNKSYSIIDCENYKEIY